MRKFLSLICVGLFALGAAAQQPEQSLADVYGQLTGRTVLYGDLPVPALSSIKAQIQADTNKAVEVIEAELAKHKIECVRDGEKFVRWLPAGWKDTEMGAQLGRLKPPTNVVANSTVPGANGPSDSSSQGLIFPTGEIDFPSIVLEQLVEVFSQISKRTVLYSQDMPPIMVHFKSRNPLSTDEALYAFRNLFILNGFVAVYDGERIVQLVPTGRVGEVRTNAPKPDPKAPLLAPGAVIPPITDVDALVEVYGKLTGDGALPSGDLGRKSIPLDVLAPMTKSELCYGIETILALNRVAIIRVDKHSIRAAPLRKQGTD